MLAIFERRHGRLGSKISGYGSIGGIGRGPDSDSAPSLNYVRSSRNRGHAGEAQDSYSGLFAVICRTKSGF
jgi:hypothetical protein